MNQTELNRQVAQQLGESIREIARRGFSRVEIPVGPSAPQDQKDKSVTTVVAA